MDKIKTVKVSKRYQIAVPKDARKALNIQAGDRFVVDIQDGMIILLPQPESYAQKLAGLHHEIWEDVQTDAYLQKERNSWEDSQSD